MCLEQLAWISIRFYMDIILYLAALISSSAALPFYIGYNSSSYVDYTNVSNLYDGILLGYDRRVRPVRNQSKPVTVLLTFSISNIIHLDTASQRLSFLGTFFFLWNDELLVWNPDDYGGSQKAMLPSNTVWKPTVVISNTFNGLGVVGHPTDIVGYTDKGNATWVPEGLFDVLCSVNTRFYPFDVQVCRITFYVSDTYSTEVQLESLYSKAMTDVYYPNMEWDLMDSHTEEEIFMGVKFIHFVLQLRRRKAYLLYTIISPLILLSVLNVGVFLVPVDTSEKGSISVTIFLSYGIFISIINNELPHNSINVSYLLNYILFLLILSVTAVLYSFIQAWVFTYHAGEEVKVGLLRALFKTSKYNNNVAVAPSKDTAQETDLKNGQHSELTWAMILRQLDVILFAVFFSLNAVATLFCLFYLAFGALM